jgi:hypothetical protein
MRRTSEGYQRRAVECFAFAKNAHGNEERTQLLIMANVLKNIAIEREQRSSKAHKPEQEFIASP